MRRNKPLDQQQELDWNKGAKNRFLCDALDKLPTSYGGVGHRLLRSIVYYEISERINERDGWSTATQVGIARRQGVTDRQVRKALKVAEFLQLIQSEKFGHRNRKRYRINWPQIARMVCDPSYAVPSCDLNERTEKPKEPFRVPIHSNSASRQPIEFTDAAPSGSFRDPIHSNGGGRRETCTLISPKSKPELTASKPELTASKPELQGSGESIHNQSGIKSHERDEICISEEVVRELQLAQQSLQATQSAMPVHQQSTGRSVSEPRHRLQANYNNIQESDLRDVVRRDQLYWLAIERGDCEHSEAMQLRFHAMAWVALTKGKKPGAYFRRCIQRQDFRGITIEAENKARQKLKELHDD